MRKMLTITLMLTLVAGIALADSVKDHRTDIETFLKHNCIHGSAFFGRSVFEGFEGGAIPATWALGITNAERTWGVSDGTDTGSVEGSFCAFVGYDLTVTQDETISFDQLVDVAGGEFNLSFWMAGAKDTTWDLNVAETVEINGVEVFDFDSNVTEHMIYERFDIDLSAYDGQTVTITFRYAGVDGDLHALDAVTVDDGTGFTPPPPPPPPTNDTCENAIGIGHGAFSIDGDSTEANDDYDAGASGCTGYASLGHDVVYTIGLAAGESFEVTMTTYGEGFDDSIYLVTDCSDPAGSCVAGADEYPDGSTFSYTAPVDQQLYLIVDAYGSSGFGAFNISGTNGGNAVADEPASWGMVKDMYR